MAYTSGRVFEGQVTGITTTPQQVATDQPNMREFILQSDSGNTTNILVGTALGQHLVLTPGQAITIPVISLSLI